MRRLIFGATLAVALPLRAAPLAGQEVPARELLLFPLGALAEPQALATALGVGLWNPAAAVLPDSARGRATVAALATSAEQGVGLQLVELSGRVPGAVTVSLSAVRAALTDLPRTDDSPIAVGDVAYSTYLFTIGGSRRQDRIAVGVAGRYRLGRLGGTQRGAFGLDAGIAASELLGVDGRIAASSFLWRPASSGGQRASYSVAADARVYGNRVRREVRAGYGVGRTESLGHEHVLFASGRWQGAELRGAIVRRHAYGRRIHRPRLAAALHRGRWSVALAREESADAFDPVYQFSLGTTVP